MRLRRGAGGCLGVRAPAPASSVTLHQRLEALVDATPLAARIAHDPLRFPRRYTDERDVEIAAVLAALLAFGRVDLFGPVVERALVTMDRRGGPARYIANFSGETPNLAYRWFRPADFRDLYLLLQRLYGGHASLGALFSPGPLRISLGGAIDTLRSMSPPGSRAFATWLPHPEDGSACKRWCMLVRWMTRSKPPDLGLWRHLDPADLVIPLDTHVMRVARHVGLTRRATPGWATAEDVTAGLRRFDPHDPVRFDFALAHLGISGGEGFPAELTEALLPRPRAAAAR